jgi:hypothetical protein
MSRVTTTVATKLIAARDVASPPLVTVGAPSFRALALAIADIEREKAHLEDQPVIEDNAQFRAEPDEIAELPFDRRAIAIPLAESETSIKISLLDALDEFGVTPRLARQFRDRQTTLSSTHREPPRDFLGHHVRSHHVAPPFLV